MLPRPVSLWVDNEHGFAILQQNRRGVPKIPSLRGLRLLVGEFGLKGQGRNGVVARLRFRCSYGERAQYTEGDDETFTYLVHG